MHPGYVGFTVVHVPVCRLSPVLVKEEWHPVPGGQRNQTSHLISVGCGLHTDAYSGLAKSKKKGDGISRFSILSNLQKTHPVCSGEIVNGHYVPALHSRA